MNIVVYGTTDVRPVIYTLLKFCQSLGDTALFTSDRHYTRLLSSEVDVGSFENIFIAITELYPDEVFSTLDISPDEFEFTIYDNKIQEEYDLFIHVVGCAETETEKETMELVDEYETINIGYGGMKGVPYSVDLFKHVEEIEGFRALREVDSKLTRAMAPMLSRLTNMPIQTVRKVVAKKR